MDSCALIGKATKKKSEREFVYGRGKEALSLEAANFVGNHEKSTKSKSKKSKKQKV